MKKILTLLLLGFAGFTAFSQNIDIRENASSPADNPVVTNQPIDRRFLGNGNTLLNMNGSLPKHEIPIMASGKDHSIVPSKPEVQLIASTLLFTGKLTDHLRKPFWLLPDNRGKKPAKD